ncbi:alpha/beta fold hydrolase [Adhaeribacter pallidiroseus]|uniref:Polyneuridine-aldehyde esterase n=1 Tax=Adhaeribacter pallidiroseus TaxID=2072847 RepID=A0A369QPK0_9BACT|nr:alpha/beta fold hydrolase [Adhaeribacter pallidiroseus]RDC66252.1 Polyneuridine-aldehyde esterase [Adhaeribacter pallidiroseus]
MKTKFLPFWATGVLLPLLLLISCKDDLENTKINSTKTYLLVHGASHGAWAWKKVAPLLQTQGHRVLAIDLPGHGNDQSPPEKVTLDDYVRQVVDVAKAQPGPVILVGHSAGGVTIAQAAERLGVAKVEKLIFLDAFLPQNGESVFSLAAKFIPPPGTGKPTFTDSFIFDQTGATFTLDTAKVVNFLYHDCSAKDIAFAKANLGKQPVAPFATPVQVTEAIYGVIPKYYIVCTEARNGNMSEMAKNVSVNKVVTLATSHSPFFSRPEALLDLLISFNTNY